MEVFKKLKLLLWKNFILKKRKTLITLLEILMPLIFSAIILYLRFNSMPKLVSSTTYEEVDISLLPVYFHHYPLKSKFQLVYIPSKSETLKAVTEMVEQTFAVDFEVLGFPSVPLFENYIIKDPKSFYILVGIVFDHSFNSSNEPLPLVVKYDLRFSYVQRNYVPSLNHLFFPDEVEGWRTAFLYPPNMNPEPREFAYADGGSPGYNKEGFLAIQHAVDKAIMWHHAPSATLNMFKNLNVLLQRFPFGPHVQDPFLVILQNEFPLLLMLNFICIELIVINSILLEKEKKLKEYMCMMGLESWLHWVAWFITFFISVLIAVSVMTILFCTKINSVAVFRNSNPSLIFIFLMCFATATIFFAFMMSTFFQRAHVGTVIGGIVFFLTYLPYLYITFSYHQRTYFQKIAFCLFSNVAMAIGVRFISLFEAKGIGIQWSNIGSVQGDFSFSQVLLLLLLDSFLYCLIAFLVDSLFSGKFGIPKFWYFLAKKPVPVVLPLLDIGDPEKHSRREFMQDGPTDQMKEIEIKHLYKVFYRGRSKRIAVKDLSMNLYQGQITVLLGHNGAGKTTICSILTGLISPSKGQAYVNGYEVSKDMIQIRKSLGWCPQHDILFDNFTVTDHLFFYGQLKGLSHQNCREEIEEMLRLLSLKHKWNSRSKFLSCGMKRKLSLGIALIAGSKVLILDEPTSGMDSTSRRAIWDILQQQKSGHTILLTTHFMDEADLLGDRIAILAKGELQCCGSPPFLKEKYGAGYYMTLIKTPLCDTMKLSSVVYHHIPNAVLESSNGEEMIFILPKKNVPSFEALFTDLEQRQTELGISTLGVSVTTLEEVFIRVYKLADTTTNILSEKRPSIHPHPRIHRVPVDRIKCLHSRIFSTQTDLPIILNTGLCLLCQQFFAMLLKKVAYSWRNWMLMLCVQILLPLVVTVLSLTFFDFKLKKMENVPLELTLKTYGQTIVPFFVSKNSHLDPQLSDNFIKMLVAAGQIPLHVQGPVEDFLLKKAKEAPEDFDKLYVVAASFEDVNNHTTVKALFNNQAYHSPSIALALVDNFLFKLLSGTNASITTTNYPQPQTAEELSESILYQGPKGHYLVINFLFGIAFLSSSFCILTVTEKNIKSKHIQFVSGVSAVAFWLSALLWDLISFLVPTLLLVLVFLWYKEEAFAHHENSPAVVLIMILYGWAVIPFIYTVSFSFKTPGNACVKLVVMLTFLSISPNVLVTVTSDKDLGYEELSNSLDHMFLILPGHCLGMAFSNLYYNFELKKFCSAKNLSDIACNDVSEGYVVQKDIYAWESLGIGKYLTALAILGPVYIILLFLIEANTFCILKSKLSGFSGKEKMGIFLDEMEDEDVLEEAEAIKFYFETLIKKNPLIVKEVSKVYNMKVPLLAVNKVSFTVEEKECFGLLGLNGAGKTSIFNMVTGEQPITSGDVFVKGFNIKSDLVKVRQWIGYCPEFDALLNFMTGREMLVMYARIRGIPERHIKTCIDQIIEDLLMHVYADKLVKTYSDGNKRMLSTAIALIGEPAVILLDEPSTGMDPVAQRLLWDTVARARESGKSIVITSHSMEECEALCTRLAIMVQGQFKCLGSPQHLKSKFGTGYSLQARVQRELEQEALKKFKAFVEMTFPGSNLEDEHQGMVQYYLPGYSLSWAKVFGIMEQAKKDYMLEDYSINQVSLEDIFLSLTSPMSSTKGKFQQGQAVVASPLSSFHLLSPLHSSSQPSIPPPSPPPSEPVLL
ncbi:ATP-binding cassette sub-family A member 17-like [Cricetulus griseus]|uniref:ATP-binding cassette sub-family A member 17-like n=1 Tax=Cricetulus griseus TaxID=10029 RepID=A0A8C2MD73_CRIGR|nr:ATP-binding cassette sub-family A member 17-like [Cricetulus griseus]XP_035316404.1 ATP-binding cassette sub-family A member 17-like [Cricetulus griseus]